MSRHDIHFFSKRHSISTMAIDRPQREFARLLKLNDGICLRNKFHGHIAVVFKLGKLAEYVGIVDLTRAGSMPPGYIGNMYQADQADILLQFLDQVSLGNLLVVKVVKKLYLGIVDSPYNLETLSRRGQIVPGVLLRIDVFQQNRDTTSGNHVGRALQPFNTTLVLFWFRESRNDVPGQNDNSRTLQFGSNRH